MPSLYWIHELGQTKQTGSLALGTLFVIGSIGTLLGGQLADHLGLLSVIKLSFSMLPVLLLILPLSHSIWFSFLLLVPIGLLVFMPYSSIVLLGQHYLSQNTGLASGVTLGLAVSVGGMATPVLGALADAHGLSSVFFVLFFISIIPSITSYFLKGD